MNKKGMFFTLIAIILVTSVILSFNLAVQYKNYNKMKVVETRTMTMDNYVNNVQRDMQRALYISTFRALVSIDNRIITNHTFVSDSKDAFDEAIIDGTLDGYPLPLMQNQTIPEWEDKVESKAAKSGFILNVTTSEISIKHTSPWKLESVATLDMELTDNYDTAYWNLTSMNISSTISILGFEDPLFSMNTNGKISRMISSLKSCNNVSSVKNLLEEGKYVNNTLAPSFLMRLENNMSASPYGIESLVNKNELVIYGESIEVNSTSVDYLYWDNYGGNVSRIDGISNDGHPLFRLDQAHVNFYNLNNETY